MSTTTTTTQSTERGPDRGDDRFIEVDHFQAGKKGQSAVGDVFMSRKIAEEGRTVLVLADGLGSGIKARVLATLTATMALKYVTADIGVRRASEIVMKTLPVCSERKIGYATFTIVDLHRDGTVRIIEYDNPPVMLVRDGRAVDLAKNEIMVETAHLGPRPVYYSRFRAEPGDRIVLCSDGVTQSGMGRPETPLGWTAERAAAFVLDRLKRDNTLSARRLARDVVHRGEANDDFKAADDISCAVVYLRRPRRLRVLTGPPIDKARDAELAKLVRDCDGRVAVCGGTTASIVARELGREVRVNLDEIDPVVPPASAMEGAALVTEGTITLNRVAELLESGADPETQKSNAAVRLLKLFLESDEIEFVVGTKINDAHQDPNLPVELDIRRTLIRRIVRLLNDKHLKQADLRFV